MRKTKIICTIGPASYKKSILKQLIRAGMDAARLNLAHGDYAHHAQIIQIIRELSNQLDKPLAIIADIPGGKMRIGKINQPKVLLKDGQPFKLTTQPILEGDEQKANVSFKPLPHYVNPGDIIFLDDGEIELKVINKTQTDINCQVIDGGELSSYKGLNLPGIAIKELPAITQKDSQHIQFAASQAVDWLAVSFVRNAADIIKARQEIKRYNTHIPIIAKIEREHAIQNIDEIIELADAIMVARGDLGLAIPIDEVPMLQKAIIKKCNLAGKPVITATQMLDSMIRNPLPTRAEVTDVANAILDGTDAVMLSGETAQGKYPLRAVQLMAKIARNTEKQLPPQTELPAPTITDAIASATCQIAKTIKATAIITATTSGYTARMVAKYRPRTPIIAVTTTKNTQRQLSISWGVQPFMMDSAKNMDILLSRAVETVFNAKLIQTGDSVVITAGTPGTPGTTNLIKVYKIIC